MSFGLGVSVFGVCMENYNVLSQNTGIATQIIPILFWLTNLAFA